MRQSKAALCPEFSGILATKAPGLVSKKMTGLSASVGPAKLSLPAGQPGDLNSTGSGRSLKRATAKMSDLAQVLQWGQNEAVLVTELQAGSDAAFDWLVTYYHGPVYNLVFGILSDTADAADVSQEVFMKAFRGIRNFRRGSSLKTWLYRIAVREALNHRRWCWRHHRQQVSIDSENEEGQRTIDLEDLEATPFEKLAASETQAVIRNALASVPEQYRSAVILRDLEGLAYEEISEVLDISVGTVKSRILRGRRALREILDPLLNAPASVHPHSESIHRDYPSRLSQQQSQEAGASEAVAFRVSSEVSSLHPAALTPERGSGDGR
jgi:RNA polymerase sigma-70 factor (ECF subfamily)